MEADFPVVLDACVLANNGVADLLLRLAEGPRLYLPLWSDEIIAETRRTLREKLEWPLALIDSREAALKEHFAEAWVSGHAPLIQCLTNNRKDRHVLAAAIRAKAEVIVTFNLKHFRDHDLEPWGVKAKHPSEFLLDLHDLNPAVVQARLHDIARDRNRGIEECLITLSKSVRPFVLQIAADLDIELGH